MGAASLQPGRPERHLPDPEQLKVACDRLSALYAASGGAELGHADAIASAAAAVRRGFTRVDTVNMARCFAELAPAVAAERAAARGADSGLTALVAGVVAAEGWPGGPLAAPLAGLLYAGIDGVLRQASGLAGRGESQSLIALRAGHEVAVLSRPDTPEWLRHATHTRLHTELAALHFPDDRLAAGSADLSRGGAVRLFGYDLRTNGRSRVEYERAGGGTSGKTQPDPRTERRTPAAPGLLSRLRGRWSGGRAARVRGMAVRGGAKVRDAYRWASAFELRREHPVAAARAAGRLARRRWPELAIAASLVVTLVCLRDAGRDLYANLSGESAVEKMPPGFYQGQFNEGTAWSPAVHRYGIYVPPHFRGEPGPFPLIVYLHGYGERTMNKLFTVGVPKAIAEKFGDHKPGGRFEFAALFPIDPSGRWQADAPEAVDVLKVLDYVMERHRIDPDRVYLTGISAGASGVWSYAELFPNRWAAVAPAASFLQPDVRRVNHIPAWLFHGGKDKTAPVQPTRDLVQQLKDYKTDVQYTEFPKNAHDIWNQVYNNPKLYEWFASKGRQPR